VLDSSLVMASRSTVWPSRALNEATTASASYRVRLNRRSAAERRQQLKWLYSGAAVFVTALLTTTFVP